MLSTSRTARRARMALAIGTAAAGALLAAGPGAVSAAAATPSCGTSCIDVFSKNFGSFTHPDFVLDVYKRGANTGQPVILFRTSNSDPAEDFTLGEQGTVSDFYQAGLVGPGVDLHYGCSYSIPQAKCTNTSYPDDFAFELEYGPYGADTGLCVGLAAVATPGEKVTLQPCGVSSDTVWIVDLALARGQVADSCLTNPLYFGELPLINGSDTNFSHPFVLTYPGSGYPTDTPRPQLLVANLTGFSQSGNALPCGGNSIVGPNSNQLWAADAGVLP